MDGWHRSDFEGARHQSAGWSRRGESGGATRAAGAERFETFAVLLVLGGMMVWEWANPQPARPERGKPSKLARIATSGPGVLAQGPNARPGRWLS